MTPIRRTPHAGARRPLRAAAAFLLLVVLAACGLKPGAEVAFEQGAGGVGANPADIAFDPSGGVPFTADPSGASFSPSPRPSGAPAVSPTVRPSGAPSPGTAGGAAPGSPGGGGGGGTSPQPPPPPPPGPQPPPPPPGPQPPPPPGNAPTGSDRTGVTDTGMVIGVHAPVTGAAPLPVESFELARDLYFKWVTEAQGQTVIGRTEFDVQFADDRYQPSTAVQACREMASRAFLLIGGGGTDQIQACGQFAEQASVPYFSAGVTTAGLEGLSQYFAFSMPYRDQGTLLAQYVARNYSGQKVAAILTDTPNFDDAVAGWEQGVQAHGINYYRTLRHPKGDTSWYNTFARELAENQVEIVYILSAPVDYIRFAQQASGQGFTPQYVGVGVSMGLNAVLNSGCPEVDGGVFFSPFPGLDWARPNVPDFFTAAQQFGTPQDDIALALWAQGSNLHQLFNQYEARYGTDLTREDFRNVVETANAESGIFPRLQYAPDDHFGADTVHVIRANCGSGEYETVTTFANGF